MRKLSLALVAAVVLFAAAALPATAAASYGTLVPIAQEIKDFFAARGVDPQYLDRPASAVPADQWQKILAVLNTPDVADELTDDHDVLNSLVGMALHNALPTYEYDKPVYMTIGNQTWIHELVSDD